MSGAEELDARSVEHGRLAGRVETLLWMQAELQLELAMLEQTDRFADTRQLRTFLTRVHDSLVRVQDGTGDPGGLLRSAPPVTPPALDSVPEPEIGA